MFSLWTFLSDIEIVTNGLMNDLLSANTIFPGEVNPEPVMS